MAPPRQSAAPRRRTLPYDAPRLTSDSYYARANEFRAWLAARHMYLDELTRDVARGYFDEFVDAWNQGALEDDMYAGRRKGEHTRYRWAFAACSPPPRSVADWQYTREMQAEQAREAKRAQRREDRRATAAWLDEHAPRATGRERLLEKKRERAAEHRAMAERHSIDDDIADGLSDEALLGTSTQASFQAALQARDRHAQRRAQRDAAKKAEHAARREAWQAKEKATRAMLAEMAKRYTST